MGIISMNDFIAGWIGGIGALLVGHPLDTLKVRQQVLHTSVLHLIKQTFLMEGVAGFYKGLSFPALMIGPSNALFFGVYANCTRYSQNNYGEKRLLLTDPNWKLTAYCAGCVAGTISVIFNTPIEVVKTLLQVQTKKKVDAKFKGVLDCLTKVYSNRGVPGVYRGFTAALYRDVPSYGLYALTYEVIVNHTFSFKLMENKLLKQILAGGSAGLLSWIFVIPIDVVKSRIQGDCLDKPKYSGTLDCVYKSYKADGWRVFTKGSCMTCFKAFPTNAAMFVIYEHSLLVLQSL